MEPTDALRSIETALRLVIRDILGENGWLSSAGKPDKTKLDAKLEEEVKRRDGVVVSSRLLDYTEMYQLVDLVMKNWEKFQPVFDDRNRTQAFFGIISDVRNSIAHSRDLVPFERDLISGIAGQLRNQVSLFRSSRNKSTKYYPLIEEVRDGFGQEGRASLGYPYFAGVRLEVGDVLTFTGSAFNSRSKPVKWLLLREVGSDPTIMWPDRMLNVAEGDSVSFEYTVTDSDVNEGFFIKIIIKADSRYHRHSAHDDDRVFLYAVNPPDEE